MMNELNKVKELLANTKRQSVIFDIWLKPKLVMKYKHQKQDEAFDIIYKKILNNISHKADYRVKDTIKILFYNFLTLKNDNKKYKRGENICTLIISMNKNYYVTSGLRTNITVIVNKMVSVGYIERINEPWFDKIKGTGECSKFIMLEKLKSLIDEYKVFVKNISIEIEELIDTVRLNKTISKKKKQIVKYNDTPKTIKMKQRMSLYNDIYKTMDVSLSNSEYIEKEIIESAKDNAFWRHYFKEQYDKNMFSVWSNESLQERVVRIIKKVDKYNINMPDFSRWYYYRVFNGDFNQNGRLTGHWILSCPSEIQDYILIDGKTTVNLDITACHCSIAASLEGIQLNYDDDFYDLGIKQVNVFKDLNGLYKKATLTNYKDIRPFIKLAVLTMINCKTEKEYLLGIVNKGVYGDAAYNILDAVMYKYPWFRKYICSNFCLKAMYLESNYIESVLYELMVKRGIKCLTVYDGLIVNEEYKAESINVMKEIWGKMFNSNILIKVKEKGL